MRDGASIILDINSPNVHDFRTSLFIILAGSLLNRH